MSDLMLLGVLRMPMPDDPDPMTLRQFVSRARQAACRIEADTDELEDLRTKCEALRKDAERYRWLRDADGALSVFTSAYFNTQTAGELDASVDASIAAALAVGAA